MSHQHLRRRLFIDRPIQIAVLFRALMYWAVCLAAQLLMVFFFSIATSSQDDFVAHSPQLWWHLQLSMIASTVLLPVILLDLLKLSHRWVGPIFRLRATLKSMSQGESITPVQFREHDFWQDLAGDLNGVAAELDRHRAVRSDEQVIKASLPAVEALPVPDSQQTFSAI